MQKSLTTKCNKANHPLNQEERKFNSYIELALKTLEI